MTYWINFLHLYQPPYQTADIINQVVKESYWVLIDLLKKNPQAKMTMNISGSLIEHLLATKNEKLILEFKKLVEKKQIELTASACYHPILPLLPETEIIRQIRLNDALLKKVFGRVFRPTGFYLPEMAYSFKVAKILKKLGFSWIILDEICYNGKMGQVNWRKKYRIKGLNIEVVFRNRKISKSFVPQTVLQEASRTKPPLFIVTATDGEMYGHHHKDKGGIELFRNALKDPLIKTKTVGQYLKMLPKKSQGIEPVAASWESSEGDILDHNPYSLWKDPKNKIHQMLWELRKLAIRIINQNVGKPNYDWARHHLDRGLASCAWWWASEKRPDAFAPITWNPDTIEKGIKELITSIRSLPNVNPKIKLQAEKIYRQLLKRVWSHHWKKYAK